MVDVDINITIIRPSLASYAELEALGSLFGAHVLKPLIAQGCAPVLANYGPPESGKSVMARQAVAQLPDFFSRQIESIKRPDSEGNEVDRVSPVEGAFRYRDFGPGTIGDEMMNEEFGFLPRKYMSAKVDARYATGVDILEHAPNWHLANADFITLTRMTRYDEDSKGVPRAYFDAIARGVAGYHLGDWTTYKGPFNCEHPRTPQILSEMRKARDLIGDEQGGDARAMTIILGNDRPEYRAAFSNFVKAVGF